LLYSLIVGRTLQPPEPDRTQTKAQSKHQSLRQRAGTCCNARAKEKD